LKNDQCEGRERNKQDARRSDPDTLRKRDILMGISISPCRIRRRRAKNNTQEPRPKCLPHVLLRLRVKWSSSDRRPNITDRTIWMSFSPVSSLYILMVHIHLCDFFFFLFSDIPWVFPCMCVQSNPVPFLRVARSVGRLVGVSSEYMWPHGRGHPKTLRAIYNIRSLAWLWAGFWTSTYTYTTKTKAQALLFLSLCHSYYYYWRQNKKHHSQSRQNIMAPWFQAPLSSLTPPTFFFAFWKKEFLHNSFVCVRHIWCVIWCVCVCVCFRLTGTDPTFFTLPGKKLCDCCWSGGVVSSQLFARRRSSLARTLTGSSTPNPFFPPAGIL
jgi:hypothetical protein